MSADLIYSPRYPYDQMQKVFDLICDPNDWKNPISVVVKGEDVNLVVYVIQWFTATTPTVTLDIRTIAV